MSIQYLYNQSVLQETDQSDCFSLATITLEPNEQDELKEVEAE
jgi:hypothetical protein